MCCQDDVPALNFESLLSDPLIRLVMESDGVTDKEMVTVLETARAATMAHMMLVRSSTATVH